MIVDTHSHLNFNAFKEDRADVIRRTLAKDIWTINVGTKYETSQKAVELAQQYEKGLYAAVGLHPMYAAAEFLKLKTDPDEGEFLITEQEFYKEKYRELAQSKKVVAIGEVGLDYYYKPKTTAKLDQFKEKQKKIFLEQIDLARELNLPLIMHCRMAHDDVIEILKNYSLPMPTGRQETTHYKLNGVIHCFTGTLQQAQEYIAMGYYIGINGIIFKFNIDDVIKTVPLDKILLETDCPYLTPLPAVALAKAGPEGYVRNEPLFIKHTIEKIAELKSISTEQVIAQTTENAKTLFNLD